MKIRYHKSPPPLLCKIITKSIAASDRKINNIPENDSENLPKFYKDLKYNCKNKILRVIIEKVIEMALRKMGTAAKNIVKEDVRHVN